MSVQMLAIARSGVQLLESVSMRKDGRHHGRVRLSRQLRFLVWRAPHDFSPRLNSTVRRLGRILVKPDRPVLRSKPCHYAPFMPFNRRVAHRAEKELGYGAQTMQHVRSHVHQTGASQAP